jgi:hypothetical protein
MSACAYVYICVPVCAYVYLHVCVCVDGRVCVSVQIQNDKSYSKRQANEFGEKHCTHTQTSRHRHTYRYTQTQTSTHTHSSECSYTRTHKQTHAQAVTLLYTMMILVSGIHYKYIRTLAQTHIKHTSTRKVADGLKKRTSTLQRRRRKDIIVRN